MLPEKRRNIIIGAIAIVILIIVIIMISILTNYIKSKDTRDTRRNDEYINNYTYFGVIKDEDGAYSIYGINEKNETSLNIKTFYDIKDMRVINKRLVFYSDALNEIRFDSKKNEFYLDELNTFYKNSYDVSLTDDYVIIKENNKLSYFEFTNEIKTSKVITENLVNEKFLIDGDMIYYILEDGIYKYDLKKSQEELVISKEIEQVYEILAISEKFIYIKINDKINWINLENELLIESPYEGEYINIDQNGFYYFDNEEKEVKLYSNVYNKLFNYHFSSEGKDLVSNEIINSDINYFKFQDEEIKRNVLVNTTSGEIIKELEQDYLYIVKVK